jgi:hypothetical protein
MFWKQPQAKKGEIFDSGKSRQKLEIMCEIKEH